MRYSYINLWLLTSFMLLLPTLIWAQGEADQVIVVPFSQQNPQLPHPAHEGAPITLKAIIRNAQCGSYEIRWDINRNNNFDDDYAFTASRNGTTRTVRDIGRGFTAPYVDRDKPLNINVRARSNCGHGDKFGTFKLFVYNFGENANGSERLSRDPRNWNDEQFEILVSMSIQEALWHTHRHMGGFSNRDNTSIRAHANYSASTGIAKWFFVINNHLPAYPPNSVDQNEGPDGWWEANRDRWNQDPYAESAMRLLNYLALNSNWAGVVDAEEDNTCGYQNRNAIRCDRIGGVNDRSGMYSISSNVYYTGMNTGAIATVLPALHGTTVKVGPAAGAPWNWYVQQLVDYLGYQQIDGDCSRGGWYYSAFNGGGHCGYSDTSTTQWAYIGLESAEVAGGPFGVFVNNRHKYRIADNFVRNQQGDGGGAYDNRGGRSDLKLTGGQLLAARWLGAQNMNPNSNTTPFPNDSSLGYSTLRNSYNRYYEFVRSWFTQRRVRGTHWQDGMWQHGDYLCGDSNRIYNAGKCGNTYSLYSHQKAYHTGAPELHHVGNYDWYRMFATYYIRAQDRYGDNNNGRSNYSEMGRIYDSYCEVWSVTCGYGSGHMSTIMGGLVLTPAVFNPKPVAMGSSSPLVVTEGCVPGNGRVTFSHQDSFHPNSQSRIVSYSWDADNSDGLWWETGAAPDLDVNGQPLNTDDPLKEMLFSYQRAGQYTPTLRVEDLSGQYKETTASKVTVVAAANVPPAIATGGPYTIEVGQDLRLRSTATDSNVDCGDKLTVSWNLDFSNGSADFEVEGERPRVRWNNNQTLSNLDRNVPHTIQVRVRDSAGLTVIEETTLRIYDKDPIADARVNPSEAACRQNVTFDASNSFHPNPQRTIANYQWVVGGRTSDKAIFTTNFNTFGELDAELTVTDDLNRSTTDTVTVNVNRGNLPPIIRVARDLITVMSNEAITLDARQSSDPNADCGDVIVAYEWDMNADGTVNAEGSQASIPVADWQNAMDWPNSDSMTILLTVRDAQGGSSTREIEIQAVRAEPVPVITQVPNPSPYRVDNGQSSTRLDGRESLSLLAGVTIARYEWDIECDGTYEHEQGQFLYEKVFPANTRLADIEANPVTVCLRITDSNGNVGISAPYEIRYQELGNTSPFADADPSDAPEKGYHILQGQGLVLDASSSFDPDRNDFDDFIREYTWTVNTIVNDITTSSANGIDDNDAMTIELSTAQLESLGIEDLGEYTVSLTVTDTSGNTGNDDSTITVHRPDATINVVINPSETSPNSRVTFDASRSEHTHPDIQITQVIWFFGDLVAVGGDCDDDNDCVQGYCIENPALADTLQCMDGALGSQEGEIVNQTFDEITPEDGDSIPVTVVIRDNNGGQSQSSSDEDTPLNEDNGDGENEIRFGISVNQGNREPVANPGGGINIETGTVSGAYTVINDNSQVIIFDGSASNDPDEEFGDEIVDYTWTIGACTCSTNPAAHGNCPLEQNQVAAVMPSLSLPQLNGCQVSGLGSFNIGLTVTDRFGSTAQSETSLNIINPPSALAQANPNRTGCQQIVDFDGRGSTSTGPADQGFGIVSYEWYLNENELDGNGEADFENPTFSVPVTAQPSGNPPQVILNARLVVTNAIGRALIAEGLDPGPHQVFDTIQVVIDVQNQPPVANPGGPYRTGGNNGNFANVIVDGRSSSDPNGPCDSIQEYYWDTDGDEKYGLEDLDGANGQARDYVGPTVSFNNPNWQANTTASVSLKVQDQFGVWSEPQSADIVIDSVIPPTGEILSPRANTCAIDIGNNNSEVNVKVMHLAPVAEAVDIKIMIAGQEVGSRRVTQYDANNEANVTIPVDLNDVPEGRHNVIATFELAGNANSRTEANSGGRVTFDFTAPVITLGAQPAENVCYANGLVPAADIDVADNFDEAPQVSQSIIESGCGRTLKVVARDYCGRESIAERDYLVAQAVSVNVVGASEGALQTNAEITWSVEGLDACASDIQAALSRDGGIAAPYAANTLVNTPGDYSLRISVWNCIGVPREQVVNFRVNRPPVAIPIADGHPNSDPDAVNGYIIAEGSPLTLDGSASTAPEFDDDIVRYTWSFPNQDDLTGERPVINTLDDGVFNGTLEVEDSLGRTHNQTVQLAIQDISPVADAGGPYVSNQGEVLRFDATRSRSLNAAADAIERYVWSWGDGTADSEGAIQEHIFTSQGAYNVTLTVFDEDSSSQVIVGVIIADVDPQIEEIFITHVQGEVSEDRSDPAVGYEILPLEFGVTATPGAPNDPITLYQWDFDGDNLFEESTEDPHVEWQFVEPGIYTVGVLVRDRDSFTLRTQVVDVKPVSFSSIFSFIDYSVERRIAQGELNILARARLNKVDDQASYGMWSQAFDGIDNLDPVEEYTIAPNPSRSSPVHLQQQGLAFLAAQSILGDLVMVQSGGVDFGLEIWSLARQLRRELAYDLAVVNGASGEGGRYADRADDPVYINRLGVSQSHLDSVDNLYDTEAYKVDVFDTNQTQGLALSLQNDARRGLDWMNIAVDQCSDPRFQSFLVDADVNNLPAYSQAAEDVRILAWDALNAMHTEMELYVDRGGIDAPSPARDQVADAAEALSDMIVRAEFNMSTSCNPAAETCSTNRSALEIELEAIKLINALQTASVNGAYVMHWQSCLVEYLRFRIEASLVAIRAQCGLFNPLYLKAKEVFGEGKVLLVEEDDIIGALNFYTAKEQQCLMLDVYNECLVQVDPDSEWMDYPDLCLQ